MGIIGEAAGRADVENEGANMEALFGDSWRPLTSRRVDGDAGHVPGCARDHALDTACGTRPLPVDADPHEAGLVSPDADFARIIAAWRWLCAWDRDTLRLNAERYARAGIREVVERLFAKGDERGAVWVSLEFAPPPGVSVAGCDVDGQPATAEQWAKLRAAGVPVADGVGV